MPKAREVLHIVKLDKKGRPHGHKEQGTIAAEAAPFQVARRANHRCRRATLAPAGEEWQPILDDPDLSESTKVSYHKALSIILGIMSNQMGKEVDIKWVMLHPEPVLAMLKTEYPNPATRKAMIVAVLGLFKRNQTLLNSAQGRPKWKLYDTVHKELHQIWSDRVHSMVPTEREIAAMVSWQEVLSAEKRLANEEYGSFNHLIISMYSMIEPLRADFNEVKIVHKDVGVDKHRNYLVLPAGTLVLSDFKTSKSHGVLKRSLPGELVKVIQASLDREPRDFLFCNIRGEPYTRNSFTKASTRVFKDIFERPVTSRILRQSFISSMDFNSTTPAQQMEIAKNMCHSFSTQAIYRRRMPS
jgi:hypothetical protein